MAQEYVIPRQFVPVPGGDLIQSCQEREAGGLKVRHVNIGKDGGSGAGRLQQRRAGFVY